MTFDMDTLTQAEIDAIKSYPEEKIKRIPVGTSSITMEMISWPHMYSWNQKRTKRLEKFIKSRELDAFIAKKTTEGLSSSEIAKLTKLTPSAVTNRKYRMGNL